MSCVITKRAELQTSEENNKTGTLLLWPFCGQVPSGELRRREHGQVAALAFAGTQVILVDRSGACYYRCKSFKGWKCLLLE